MAIIKKSLGNCHKIIWGKFREHFSGGRGGMRYEAFCMGWKYGWKGATDQLKAENERLKEALKANVRRCSYYNGKKLCNKIGVHMTNDYDSCTEYRCDEHKGVDCFNRSDDGEFQPSRLAEQTLKGD